MNIRYTGSMRFFPMALLRFMLLLILACGGVAQAAELEGVGHASIRDGNLEQAREQARKAAMRDLALQYGAQVDTRDTVENGVLTESSTRVASSALLRNSRIVDESVHGSRLRVTVRAQVSEQNTSCGTGAAAGLGKRVAVTGFPVRYPEQARLGRIDDAGEIVSRQLQDRLLASGRPVQVYGAAYSRMFDNLLDAPTSGTGDNSLSNVLPLAREMGVQFVVTGVIRDLGVSDPSAWGTSVLTRMQRSLGTLDQSRRFVVDLMMFDGFSGAQIFRQQFAATAVWDAAPGTSGGFGAPEVQKTAYGQAVAGVIADMADTISGVLACQPFMTRVVRVNGTEVTLASGAAAGLRPGDELHLYRSARYFDSLGGTPELTDARVSVALDSVHPDFSNGRMARTGGEINIQQDDIAIVW